jgi:hypothetical protein
MMRLTINTVMIGIVCVVAAHIVLEVVTRFVVIPGRESLWSYAATCLALLAWFIFAARSKKVSDAR